MRPPDEVIPRPWRAEVRKPGADRSGIQSHSISGSEAAWPPDSNLLHRCDFSTGLLSAQEPIHRHQPDSLLATGRHRGAGALEPDSFIQRTNVRTQVPDMLLRNLRISIIAIVLSILTIHASAEPLELKRASRISAKFLEGISALYRSATREVVATGEFTLPGTTGCSVTPLACGTERSGLLGPGDCIPGSDGTYMDIWTFQGIVGQTVTITMRSESFDSYLYLANPSGGIVLGDDNSAGALDARIEFTLTETGEWGIIANQLHSAGGPYQLSLECSASINCPVQIRGTTCGGIIAGTIDATDCVREGLPVEFWSITGTAGQNLVVTASRTSQSGSVGLVISDEAGTPLATDSPDDATSSLSVTLPETGTWVVTVVGTAALDYSMNIECQSLSTCFGTTDSLCLSDNRFRVTVVASDPRTGKRAIGRAAPYNDINGFFTFPGLTQDTANLEVFVKVLDGRTNNGHFWVFYGGLTDFAYTLTVFETSTGLVKTYIKPGLEYVGGADTSAF